MKSGGSEDKATLRGDGKMNRILYQLADVQYSQIFRVKF